MESADGNLPLGLRPINVRGVRLAYKESGVGQPLILVHPNISDIRCWDAIFPLLAKNFRVIAYCRRYHWPLEAIPDETSDPWEDQAEDLAALIKALGVSPACLMGNSSGAVLALFVARKYPELVHSLVLEEPPAVTLFLPRSPPSLLDVLKLLIWHPRYFFPLVYFGATVIDPTEKNFKRNDVSAALNVFLRGVLGEEHFKALSKERWEQTMANAKPHQAVFCYNGPLPSFTEDDAKAITAPTLLLGGEKAVPAHKCFNEALTTLIPGANAAVISGASHLMHEDDPKQVADKIVEWGCV